jgi:hypothetical protein
MKDIRLLCKKLNIEADYLNPLLNKYPLKIVKIKLQYIIDENIKREKANEQLIENPYAYLKKLLSRDHEALDQNQITGNDLNILPDEFLKLSNKHGNDFLKKKLTQTNKIAEMFSIKNKTELFNYLISEDEGSNKYGIDPLIKNNIESLQVTINETKMTLESITKNTLDTADKRIDLFEENMNRYSKELAESYKNSVDKNNIRINEANSKYIEQSKILFDEIKEQSLQIILPEMKKAISETIKINKNYLDSTINIIKNKMEVSFKFAATCGLIFLLIGVFLGVYMAPLIEWISIKLNFDYGLLILFVGFIFSFVVGVLFTVLIYKRLKNRVIGL